jgi:hypothetical protein
MNVLLLIGSAKQPHGNSESLGTYLIERLRERGAEPETMFLHRSLHTDETRAALLAASERADVLVLAFPLYVDSLPYLVIQSLELIAAHRRTSVGRKRQRLVCVVNCGFPEAHHNDTAIAICRRFAHEADFEWAGGLGLGGGEALNGQPLQRSGGMARNVVKSLDLAASALADGKAVPQEAIVLMAKPLVPVWMYMLLGSFGWKRLAKKYGVQHRLYERPYEVGEEK